MTVRALAACALLAASCVLAACQPAAEGAGSPASAAPPVVEGTGFDFYVLSLSWSPSYCAIEGEDANRQQCGSGRPYAFVVHGLWPQFEDGYPEFCRARQDRVPDGLVARMLDLMPSAGLIGHQWRKHGTCTGLSQEDYFAVVRAARERVDIPDRFIMPAAHETVTPEEVERSFVARNPLIPHDGIAVTCSRRHLREVRICMDRGLGFRSCAAVDRQSCRSGRIDMPPVRGR